MINTHSSIIYAEVTKFKLAFTENDPALHNIPSRIIPTDTKISLFAPL